MSELRRGRFALGARLGVGEVTETFLAKADGASTSVVLSCLRPEFAQSKPHVERFVGAAGVLAELRHQNVRQLVEVSRDDSSYYMALELVDGPSLRDLVGHARALGLSLPVELGVFIVAEAARGLHYAHDADRHGEPLGIVHRRVSPKNIFISKSGEVKVAGFGAGLTSAQRRPSPLAEGSEYNAPELESRALVDRRCDVFSLGVILRELTGADDTFLMMVSAQSSAPNPRERHATAGALEAELREWLERTRASATSIHLAQWLTASGLSLGAAQLQQLALSPGAALSRPKSEPPSSPGHALPDITGKLIGRDRELAQMDAAIARGSRWVHLHGPGGVGKTRLALEWAHRAGSTTSMRAIFCDAQHASSPEDVAQLIISQLTPASVQPRASRDPIATAAELLAARGATVLVLDEVDSASELSTLTEALLESSLETFTISTSRQGWAASAARTDLAVAPFSVESASPSGPAAQLFFERLESSGGAEMLSRWRDPAHAQAVQQALHRSAGLPLALMVTASHVAAGSPTELDAGEAGRQSVPSLTSSLRAAWNACGPDEREALLQATTFFGPFDLAAAKAVMRTEGDLEAVLAALLQRALLERRDDRYRLHMSVRELCADMTPTASLADARERHARHVIETAEAALHATRGRRGAAAFATLEAYEAELRGVHQLGLARTRANRSLRAALCLEPTLARRGEHRGLITLLQNAAGAGSAADGLSARAAMAEARAHGWLFEFQEARDAALRGSSHAATTGDEELLAQACSELAMVEVRCGEPEAAARLYREALATLRKSGDRRGEGIVLLRLANLMSEEGETGAASVMYRVALEASRAASDRIYEGMILSNLGAQLLDDGSPDQAHRALYLSHEIFEELGEERYGAVSRALIGVSLGMQGDWAQGAEVIERALSTLRRIGERGIVAFLIGALVSAATRRNDAAAAQSWLGQMMALERSLTGTPFEHMLVLRRAHLDVMRAAEAARGGDEATARALIAGARRCASAAPANKLTTLRIAAADLWAHCDEVETQLFDV